MNPAHQREGMARDRSKYRKGLYVRTHGSMPDCKFRYGFLRRHSPSRSTHRFWCTGCKSEFWTDNSDYVMVLWAEHRVGQPTNPTEVDRLLDIGRLHLGLWCDEEMVCLWRDCPDCHFPDMRGLCNHHRKEYDHASGEDESDDGC